MNAYFQFRARCRMSIGESLRGVWLTLWGEVRRTLVPFSALKPSIGADNGGDGPPVMA